MTFVDHLKGNSPEALMLEVAFGRHVVAGDLCKSIVTGSDSAWSVTVQQALGEAFGKGWAGPLGVWFRGVNRPEATYTFHPGIQSSGPTDPDQGIDDTFDQDTPHSNTAWIRLDTPSGTSEVGYPDFDTKSSPPTGHSGIYECQLGDIYDADGEITNSGVLLLNPADVIAFLCKVVRRYPDSRIDWASLDTLRTLSNVTSTFDSTTLPQGVGLTGYYYDGTSFSDLKSQRVDPVIEYESSDGAPALNLTPTSYSVRWLGKISFEFDETYTIYLTHDDYGTVWIDDLGTPIIDETSYGTHSATFDATAGTFYDIKLEWVNTGGPGGFKLEWESDSTTRQVIPQDRLYPNDEPLPRFESHVKFTDRTTFEDALSAVLFTCNGTFQDANGKLKFFCLSDEEPSFTFDESNIIKGTFKYYPRYTQAEMLQLPNRFVADARDLDSRYLEKFDPPLFYDNKALQDLSGRVIEETLQIGNMRRPQALSNLEHYARLKSAPMVAEFDGMPSTLQVLPGDVVIVTYADNGLLEVRFLCVEATDKSTDKDADNRSFKLVYWSTEDDPHGLMYSSRLLTYGSDYLIY